MTSKTLASEDLLFNFLQSIDPDSRYVLTRFFVTLRWLVRNPVEREAGLIWLKF